MDLISVKHACASLCRVIALIVFGIGLCWPVVHIAITQNSKMSTWRIFGWGMYATPNPEAQSRLRIVITDPAQAADVSKLFAQVSQLQFGDEDSHCINLFVQTPTQKLQRVSHNGLCKKDNVAKYLDYFLHFGATKYLAKFTEFAFAHIGKPQSQAYAYLTRQRFNLLSKRAYLESDVYKLSGFDVQHVGTISYGGQ